MAFTEGHDEDILALVKRTGMVGKKLDQLNTDFLVYKLRDFLTRNVEKVLILEWLECFFKEGCSPSPHIEWHSFLTKVQMGVCS